VTGEQEKNLVSIKRVLPNYEEPRRLSHTLGVYEECVWLAGVFALDAEDTYSLLAAALLHDITKSLSEQEADALCRKHGIRLPEGMASVIPQYTAAPFEREIFGAEMENDKVVSNTCNII